MPPLNRSFSDDISFTGLVRQMVSTFAGSTRGSPRSSTKSLESSESSESAESHKSESSTAEESPEGSGIFFPIASVTSFSDDERARIQVISRKQDDKLRRRIVEATAPISAEPDRIKPEITKVINDLAGVGLDGGGAQVAA